MLINWEDGQGKAIMPPGMGYYLQAYVMDGTDLVSKGGYDDP